MIQDVRTRWSSTYDMLLRALTLRSILADWIDGERNKKLHVLQLSSRQWQQVKYLLALLKPFKKWTESLSVTKGVTIHLASHVYHRVLGHLLRLENRFALKDFEGKTELCAAMERGREKLAQYFVKAGRQEGLLYNLATVIDPSTKLTQYKV